MNGGKGRRRILPATTSEVGYCRAPEHSRFKPGQSGNPRGRPKRPSSIDQVLQRALERRVPDPRGGRRKISMLELIVQSLVLGAATTNLYPCLDVDSAIVLIRRTNHDAWALDFEHGRILLDAIHVDSSGDHTADLRAFLFDFIHWAEPWWIRLIPYGREKLRSALKPDQIQCFRAAGLLDAHPVPAAVAWWDKMIAFVRGIVDSERMSTAREVERLSLVYEQQRLERLGIEEKPVWVSLDDNTLGYDILSYDRRDGRVVNRLVEVKSTQADTIFVTRNEWENASSAEQRYVFHVWKMPEQVITEFPVAAVRPHVPLDQGRGDWQAVRMAIL